MSKNKQKNTSTIFLVAGSTILIALLFTVFFYLPHDIDIESKLIVLIAVYIGTLLSFIGAFLRKEGGTSATVKSFVFLGLILIVFSIQTIFWNRSSDNWHLMLIQMIIGAAMTIIGLSLKKKYSIALR
jgi:O-antigen/teichoic acid export membrane protein